MRTLVVFGLVQAYLLAACAKPSEPDRPDPHFKRGTELWEKNRGEGTRPNVAELAEAISEFEHAVDDDSPSKIEALKSIVMISYSLEASDKRELSGRSVAEIRSSACSQLANAAPRDPEAIYRCALRKPRAEALQDMRRAIALAPDDPRLHHVLATLLRDSGQIAEAVDQLRQAVQLEKNAEQRRSYRLRLVDLLREAGRDVEADQEESRQWEGLE